MTHTIDDGSVADVSKGQKRPDASSSSAAGIPVAGGVIAVLLGLAMPLVSPLLLGLALGVVVANLPGTRLWRLSAGAALAKSLLRWGVVGLGFQISVGDLASLGAVGVLIVVATVAITFWATTWMGRWLGIERGLVVLVATGFSICGAAAIAAVSDVIRSRQRDVGLAIALVTVFGSAVMLVLPLAADVAGLNSRQTAIWAGSSIHEVAQVVGAASLIGPSALATATAIKLARVVLLAPVIALVAASSEASSSARTSKGPRGWRLPVPWFVAGFLVAAAVRSTGVTSAWLLDGLSQLTVLLLAAGMFGMGAGIRVRELWPLSSRALLMACLSTVVALVVPLVLVTALA